MRDASEILDYLHGRAPPVIHRDLKPGNVIRRPDGSFAFVDFGAVRDKLRPGGGSTIVGTFGYMAPEQFQGRALPASDVYAIGATTLSMLTGRQPEDLPHKGLAIDVRAALGDRASPRLADALALMLDPDPNRRPSKIAPVLSQLERGPRSQGRGVDHAEAHSSRSVIADRLERQAEEYDARAREYEGRASAGGAGARGWRHGAEGWQRGARKLREEAQRHLVREARDAEERIRRLARKEARRAERAARRAGRRQSGEESHRPPWPVALLFSLVFAFGMVAVAIATQVVVPAVLRLLSLFFARRGLTAAANAVRQAGEEAMSGIDRSREWFRGAGVPSETADDGEWLRGAASAPTDAASDERIRVARGDAKVRVEGGDAKVRVEGGAAGTPEDDEAAAPEADKATR